MSNLYQDALIDAKALRATALANAKAAIQEAFEPKIQEMLRLKLSEELETEGLEEEMQDENIKEVEEVEENLDINEAELEEILSQLEELSSQKEGYEFEEEMNEDYQEESLNEAEEEADDETDAEEDDDEVADDEVDADAGEEGVGDDTKVIDITLGDLKQVLQSVMAGQQDLGMDSEAPAEENPDADDEAEISLEEILDELEMEEGAEELGRYDASLVHEPDTQGSAQGFDGSKIFEKKKGAYNVKPNSKKEKADAKNGGDLNDTAYNKIAEENELEEAKATIESLRQDLQEVNLLNAKYLYMNKLFKSKNLSESQKVKVVKALDRANSVAEVKNTFDTLKESFEAKTQLKESFGFASQAAGIAPKKPIIESDNMINRWQTLAGIKK